MLIADAHSIDSNVVGCIIQTGGFESVIKIMCSSLVTLEKTISQLESTWRTRTRFYYIMLPA